MQSKPFGRRISVVGGALLTAVLVYLVSQAVAADEPVNWRFGEQAGVLTLPLDSFSASQHERYTIEYARSMALSACLPSHVTDRPPVDRRADPVTETRRYGLMSPRLAARYGYRVPPDTSATAELQRQNAAELDSSDAAAIATCSASAPVQALTLVEPLAGDQAAFALYPHVMALPDALAARSAWVDCLAAKGIVVARSGSWTPEGLSEGQSSVDVAIEDVACKKRVRLIERLAAIEAREQERVVSSNSKSLALQRRAIEEKLALAKATIEGAKN